MNYNNINFLVSGNDQTPIIPLKLLSSIDTKGKMKLNKELYLMREEILKYSKQLQDLYTDLTTSYALKEVDTEGNVIEENGKEKIVYEDTISNGKAFKRPAIQDRELFEKDLEELFNQELTFESKLTEDYLDGVILIGQIEYSWLKALNLLK